MSEPEETKKTGTSRSAVARRVGWTLEPPISRSDAEKEFGSEISEAAWREICEAFERHGDRSEDRKGSRDNQDKNDPQSWHKQRQKAEKAIMSSIDQINSVQGKFIRELEVNFSLNHNVPTNDLRLKRRIDLALDELHKVLSIVEQAETFQRQIPTEAQSKKILAQDIFDALEGSGATLSNRWGIENASYADLTGFEKLIELLEIHAADTPSATAKWVSRAVKAQNR
jgi:hypothetical protein